MFQEALAATGHCGHVETSTALSSRAAGHPRPYRLHTTAVKFHPTRATHPFSNNPPVMAAPLRYAVAQARTAGKCWVACPNGTSHKHSNMSEKQGVNPHLLSHTRIPNNCTSPQCICISNKFVRPLSAWEELTNTPLPMINKLSLLKQNPHQRRCPVVVQLGGYITSLQLCSTVHMDSLKRTTQLLGQLSLIIGTNIPGDWEPFIRFNLQSGHIWVLLIK